MQKIETFRVIYGTLKYFASNRLFGLPSTVGTFIKYIYYSDLLNYLTVFEVSWGLYNDVNRIMIITGALKDCNEDLEVYTITNQI